MEDGTRKKRSMRSDMKMMLRVHLRLSNSGQGSILSLILGLLPSEVFASLFFMQIIGISAKKPLKDNPLS